MEYIPVYLLIGAAVFCIFGILIILFTDRSKVLESDGKTFIDAYFEDLKLKLDRSRTGITLGQYMLLQIGIPVALAVIAYFISDNRTLMIVFILLGAFMPNTVLSILDGRQRRKFEDEFVRALSQMASSLHSGMTIEQAVDSVVNCELMTDDIRDDFRTISSKMKLGTSISDAFFEYAKFTGSKDCADVATAVTIMMDVGGDAGVAIEKLQKNIEDRLQYRKQRNSMMTESTLIAAFADWIPVIILAGTYILMPGTIASYFESTAMTITFIVIIVILLIGSAVVHGMLNDKEDAY